MIRVSPIVFPATFRFLRKFIDHVCVSGVGGTCAACKGGPTLALIPAVEADPRPRAARVRRARKFLRDRRECTGALMLVADKAHGVGLSKIRPAAWRWAAVASTAYTAATLAECQGKLATYEREIERVEAARERRDLASARKRAVAGAKAQAEREARIAKRRDWRPVWRVWLTFRAGAHDVIVAQQAPAPRYREARNSKRQRGEADGLTYARAEAVAGRLRLRLARNASRKVTRRR